MSRLTSQQTGIHHHDEAYERADWRHYRKLGGELDIHAFARLTKANRGSTGWLRNVPKATRDALTAVRSEEGLALAHAAREASR